MTLTAYTNSNSTHTGPFTVHGLDHKTLAADGIDTADRLAAFLLAQGAEVSVEPCGSCTMVTGWFGDTGAGALMTN